MPETQISEILPEISSKCEKVASWELTPEEDRQIDCYASYMDLINPGDPIVDYSIIAKQRAFGIAGITLSGKKVCLSVEHISASDEDWLFINTKKANGQDSTEMYYGNLIHDPEQSTFFRYLSFIFMKYENEKIEKY